MITLIFILRKFCGLGIFVKEDKAMAVLENREHDIEIRAPTYILKVSNADQMPPIMPPTEDMALVHFAYASLKHNLLQITARRVRSMENLS